MYERGYSVYNDIIFITPTKKRLQFLLGLYTVAKLTFVIAGLLIFFIPLFETTIL